MTAQERSSLVDETTPLIAGAEEAPAVVNEGAAPKTIPEQNSPAAVNGGADADDDKPLEGWRTQVLLLSYARFIEPLSFFCIFPFVNQMIADTGEVRDEEVGFYSGLIESLFSLTQTLLMIAWGRAADRFGRKPVLVYSLAGLSIASSAFGFAQTVWQMMLLRCLAGTFGGLVVTVRTMISENSTPATQARAFSWFSFASNLGLFMGPLIGGSLARPAIEFPRIFGHIQFFHSFPYALPTLICGAVNLTALATTIIFVRETLPKPRPSGPGGETPTRPKPPTTYEILRSPHIPYIITLYGLIMILAFAFTALWPIFLFTPIHLGGLEFTPFQISLVLALGGAAQSTYMLVVFPPLQHRIGTIGILRWSALVWPVQFTLFPTLIVYLRRRAVAGLEDPEHPSNTFNVLFWVVLVLTMTLLSGVSMSFTAVQLALNDLSPGPLALGTLNALALTMISATRAVAPGVAGAVYATGTKYQVVGGQLGWVVLVALTLVFGATLRWFPKEAEGWVGKKKRGAGRDAAEENEEDS